MLLDQDPSPASACAPGDGHPVAPMTSHDLQPYPRFTVLDAPGVTPGLHYVVYDLLHGRVAYRDLPDYTDATHKRLNPLGCCRRQGPLVYFATLATAEQWIREHSGAQSADDGLGVGNAPPDGEGGAA
ncbi:MULTISPECIES: hypothetical protein [unclassified Nonomuraea]|uniref:hypothetical protein n=1 Tax=unclassified Nonomuraea TaxID=2593643 RepID=UPI0033F3BE97